MNIQERINSLNPYVVQMRFVDGTTIVDAVFKEGWKVPTSKRVQSVKSEDEAVNYHMFYTETEGLGLDDVLDYIEQVINLNIEREKKYELLKIKTDELKNLFREQPLSKLQNMTFVLGGEKLIPDTMPEEFDDISIGDIDEPKVEKNTIGIPGNGTPIEEPEETTKVETKEPEMPKRTKKNKKTTVRNQEIELPPKSDKIELETHDSPEIICKCVGDDVCPVCVEEKMAY